MKDTNKMTPAELRALADLREMEHRAQSKPVRLAIPDPEQLERIAKILQSELDDIESGEYHEDNDNKYYIYEHAAKAFFGPSFFGWKGANR